MAASLRTEIEDVIQCSICLEPMTDARVLSCHHSFCYKCLEPLTVNQNLKCPKCRKSTRLHIGLEHLQKDFTLNKLAASFRKQRVPSIICAACPNQTKPSWLCLECQDYLCQTCTDAHNKIQLFETHTIVSMANAEEKCPKHKRKELSYICVVCEIFVCGVCILTDHQEHQVENAEMYLRNSRRKLQSELFRINGLGLNAIVDNLKTVNLLQLEADVTERFSAIRRKISAAAIQHSLRIKLEEASLQQSLTNSEKQFDAWLDNIKRAKLLGLKVAEFKVRSGAYGDNEALAPKQETLNGIKNLSAAITATIDVMTSTQEELNSFCSLEIAEHFAVTHSSKTTIGTISNTTEIRPGLPFSIFSNQLLPSDQSSRAVAMGPCDESLIGLECMGCFRPLVETWYECSACNNYSICSTCKAMDVHIHHEMHGVRATP